MRFLSDALDLFQGFVTVLDILRLIASKTGAARPPGRLALPTGASVLESQVTGPDEVRLVGTDLGDVRAREAVSTPIDRLHALEG